MTKEQIITFALLFGVRSVNIQHINEKRSISVMQFVANNVVLEDLYKYLLGSKLVIPVMLPCTTESQLTDLCKPYGTICHQMLVPSADQKSSLGIVGFCEFNAADIAVTALASVGTVAFSREATSAIVVKDQVEETNVESCHKRLNKLRQPKTSKV
ncbi:hypothetical protein Tsp_09264 [Trichinella spiralis]|uniref:hypothetical protein n=1 Tax=Trichinella spiralis TaxID=6334 RepID=UPI0001EFC524|nr:hypothetical protein Tsp_09264 [Trichinella spiralis]